MNTNKPDVKPINLQNLYGKRFKIVIDESAFQPGERKDDPWYYQIPCKIGHIYPYSDKMLGFYCESGNIRNRLHREHPEIEVVNWSDDGEAIFLFTPDQFNIVAEYAKPKRKRRLSQEHRRKLEISGQRYKFKSSNHGSNDAKSTQISTKRIEDVFGDGQTRETRLEHQKSEIKG